MVTVQPQEGNVREVPELTLHSRVDPGMVVPVQVGPDRRVSIEVLASPAVAQGRTLAGDDHQGIVFRRAPVAHLRERMPGMRLVQVDPTLGLVHGSGYWEDAARQRVTSASTDCRTS